MHKTSRNIIMLGYRYVKCYARKRYVRDLILYEMLRIHFEPEIASAALFLYLVLLLLTTFRLTITTYFNFINDDYK